MVFIYSEYQTCVGYIIAKIFFLFVDCFFKIFLNLFLYYFCFMFSVFGWEARGILAAQTGIKPAPPALEGKVHWTARDDPGRLFDSYNHVFAFKDILKFLFELNSFFFLSLILQFVPPVSY